MFFLKRSSRIILVGIFLISCKIEEFTGFQVETISQNESLRLTGNVFNYFTNDSVPGAMVKIGNRKTMTDINGSFVLQYVLSESEKRNKPTSVTISAPNYYDLQENILLSSTNTQFTFYLKYAAPIILDMTLVYQRTFDYNYICQAIIRDYQGVFTIQSVKAVFFSRDFPDDSLVTFLSLKKMVGTNDGNFQSMFSFENWVPEWFYIEVVDREGYRDSKMKPISEDEEFLFDP